MVGTVAHEVVLDSPTAVPAAVGPGGLREWIIATFQEWVWLLYPMFFTGFFIAAAIALAFHRRSYIKRTYVAGFLAVLVMINLIGLPILPMIFWHKFSEPRPEAQTHYEFRVVDAEGDELPYDAEATLQTDNVRFAILQREMLTEYSREKNERVAGFLLRRARVHREKVTNRSPLQYLRFPPNGVVEGWDGRNLSRYSTFVGIRLYEIRLNTSADGTAITSRSETMLLEFYPEINASATTNTSASTTIPHRKGAIA
jgi:hypothetical protein